MNQVSCFLCQSEQDEGGLSVTLPATTVRLRARSLDHQRVDVDQADLQQVQRASIADFCFSRWLAANLPPLP